MGKKSRLKPSQSPVQNRNTVVREPVLIDTAINAPSLGVLTVLVLACLTPFLGKAFNIDDTLFIWAARQISRHPWDPFGFNVNWNGLTHPMWEETQNPPLASYYIAAVAGILGWSETALHAGFLLVALAAIVGTYVLAQRLTRLPLLAAAATLAAPGFLVSATTVMCDTMMVALFVFAVFFWLEGLDRKKPALLAVSGLLIAVSALTKYFAISLIPLLLVYTLARRRRFDNRILYLLLPVAALAAYQFATKTLYGSGMLGGAVEYARARDSFGLYKTLVGLSFAGGCALPALTFAPAIWSRRMIVLGGAAAAFGAALVGGGFLDIPGYVAVQHRSIMSLQMGLFIAGGISAIALAITDWRRRRDAGSLLLLLWVSGTFAFAAFVNWSVNARSVLPMIPAVGILLARRLETLEGLAGNLRSAKLIVPLALSAAISLWVTRADASLANSSRMAAQYVHDRVTAPGGKLSFEGHWGFQYYMQSYGFEPVEFANYLIGDGDVLVIPAANTSLWKVPANYVASRETFSFPLTTRATTMSAAWGAAFYSDNWGPLPYAFCSAGTDLYHVLRLKIPAEAAPRQLPTAASADPHRSPAP